MKTYGKVIFYNKYEGTIKGVDGNNYILKNDEIEETIRKILKKDDYVEFTPERYNTIETNLFVARDIKRLEKEATVNEEGPTKGIK